MQVLKEDDRTMINCQVCGEVGAHKWLDFEYAGALCPACMLFTIQAEQQLLATPGICRPTQEIIARRL